MGQTSGCCAHRDWLAPLTLFLIISASLFLKFRADKHLSQDGVSYFFHILENKSFANIAWSRQFTEYLTEWPLVTAVRSGITDIELLVKVFALGIYLPYLISFLLCWYVVRDEDKSLLWFPLAGYIGFNVLSDYDLIADHHVLAVMTWPIFLMLVKTRPLQWSEGLVLWLLLVAYSRMYETAVLIASILAVIALGRLYWFRTGRERLIMGVALGLLALVAYIAVQYIIDPRSPQNRGAFLDSIWVNQRNWEAVATNAFLLILGLGWLINRNWKKLKNAVFLLSLVPIGIYAYFRLTHPDYAMTAYISFSSRTLIGLVVPGLMLGCVIVVLLKSKLTAVGVGAFVAGFVVMTLFNLYDLRYWNGVREEFARVMDSDQMFISIDDTPLGDEGLDLRHYRWSWNNPLLSLVWSGRCVKTIVLNSPNDPQGPFDPREKVVLKEYLEFDKKFRSVDPSITICQER